MSERAALSPMEQRVFSSIADFSRAHGYPPTLSEIAADVGISRSSVHKHVWELKHKGWLRLEDNPGSPRTLVIAE